MRRWSVQAAGVHQGANSGGRPRFWSPTIGSGHGADRSGRIMPTRPSGRSAIRPRRRSRSAVAPTREVCTHVLREMLLGDAFDAPRRRSRGFSSNREMTRSPHRRQTPQYSSSNPSAGPCHVGAACRVSGVLGRAELAIRALQRHRRPSPSGCRRHPGLGARVVVAGRPRGALAGEFGSTFYR